MPTLIAELFNQKRLTHQPMGRVCATALAAISAGSAEEVTAQVGQMAKLRGELEYTDKAIFEAAPMVFMLLIDQQPDAQNRMRNLSITKAQVDALAKQIDNWFGAKLNGPKANYTVSTALVLREALTKKGYSPRP